MGALKQKKNVHVRESAGPGLETSGVLVLPIKFWGCLSFSISVASNVCFSLLLSIKKEQIPGKVALKGVWIHFT